jgi:hypothetical protein
MRHIGWRLIHLTSWKWNSTNVAFTEFYEVRLRRLSELRTCTLLRSVRSATTEAHAGFAATTFRAGESPLATNAADWHTCQAPCTMNPDF